MAQATAQKEQSNKAIMKREGKYLNPSSTNAGGSDKQRTSKSAVRRTVAEKAIPLDGDHAAGNDDFKEFNS